MMHKGYAYSVGAQISYAFGTRKCLILAMLLTCVVPSLAAAAPPWTGAISAGGDGYTLARAIKVATNDDYYVTGEFSSTANFAPATVHSRGGSDIFLAKYSASGSLQWIVTAGSPGDDVGWGLDLDSGGNVYLSGWFTNTATFDSANKTSRTVSGTGDSICLAKYSSSGNLVWVQTGAITIAGLNRGYGVAVNSAARTVYLTALSQGNTTFSSANGTANTIPGVTTWHVVLARYDTDGNFEWAQTNQGSPNSVPYGIAVDAGNNAYVTGWMEDETTFSSANGSDITVTGFSPAQTNTDYPGDAFLAKYDQDGNAVWVNHIGGYKAISNSVAVSPRGDVTLVGYIGNLNNGSEASTIVSSQLPRKNYHVIDKFLTDPYNPDVMIVTYTAAGVLETAVRIGHEGNENANGVTYDTSGDLYVTGSARQSPTIRSNLFIRKYHAGVLQWEQKAGSSALWLSEGTAPSVSVGATGNIYVAGGFQHWARFGPSTLSGNGSSNMFVAVLPPQ